MDNDFPEYLPVGDLDNIRRALKAVELLRERSDSPKTKEKELAHFFFVALTPFYDCMWEGMKPEAGHVIYRLSDHVDSELRRAFEIYPKPEYDEWHSLEDWRAEWERLCPEGIPTFEELLKTHKQARFLLGDNK